MGEIIFVDFASWNADPEVIRRDAAGSAEGPVTPIIDINRYRSQSVTTATSSSFEPLQTYTTQGGAAVEIVPLRAEDSSDTELLFRSELTRLLKDDPIEDGFGHPAEEVLEESLKRNPASTPTWIANVYVEAIGANPALAAGLLQCLGRLPYQLVQHVGRVLAVAGLQHRHVQVREAALSAIEQWNRAEFRSVLSRHNESVPWLAEYLHKVLDRLG